MPARSFECFCSSFEFCRNNFKESPAWSIMQHCGNWQTEQLRNKRHRASQHDVKCVV